LAVIYIISSFISSFEKTTALYKKAGLNSPDFFKTLKPMFILEVMLLTVFSIYTWFTW